MTLTSTQLRAALADIESAEARGFMFCEAVFEPRGVDMAFIVGRYSDLIEKAHPTDGNLNWGRFQRVTRTRWFIDGKLSDVEP